MKFTDDDFDALLSWAKKRADEERVEKERVQALMRRMADLETDDDVPA